MADSPTVPSYSDYIAQYPPEQQPAARDAYFSRYVQPKLREGELDDARASFDKLAPLPEAGFFSELGKGFQRGLATKGMGLAGSTALAAQATGDRAAIDRANQIVRQQAADMKAYQSPYSNYENVHDVKSGLAFAGSAIGEMAGNVLPTMGMAALSGPAAPVTAAADIIGTTAGNQYAQTLKRADTETALNQYLDNQPVDLSNSYQSIDKGKLALGTAGTSALEAAGYALGPAGKLIFRGKAGLGKTATDLLTKEGLFTSRAGNAAVGAVQGGLGEGATEFAQEFTDEYGAGNPDWLSKETARQGLQAAVSAAVGGGVMGAGGGYIQAPAGSAASRDVGPTYEDRLRAEGLLDAPQVPPEPSPSEIAKASKDEATARVDALEAAAPNVFLPLKKGDNPNQPLSLTAFSKRIEDQWKSGAPQPTEAELDEAFAQAVEGGYTKDYKAFGNELKKQRLAEYETENPRPSSADVVSLWRDYSELHKQGIRGFKTARNWLDGLYADMVEPNNPAFDANVPVANMPTPEPNGLPSDAALTNPDNSLIRTHAPNTTQYDGVPTDTRIGPAPVRNNIQYDGVPTDTRIGPAPVRNDIQYDGVPTDTKVRTPNVTPPTSGGSNGLPSNVSGGALFTPPKPQGTAAPINAAPDQTPPAPIVTPAPKPAPAQPRQAPKAGKVVNVETDDLIMAIRRLGGLNVESGNGSDFAGRLKSINTPKIVGLPNVERTKGKGRTLDDLAEVLHEHGYLKTRDAGELYQRLQDAEQSPQWAYGKQDFANDDLPAGSDRWATMLDQANSEDEVASIARQAGADSVFVHKYSTDATFKQQWDAALDHALNAVSMPERAQPEAPAPAPTPAPTQDLFPEATSTDKAQADQAALVERQKETQRRLNATQAPQGGGLFDQDNRQTEMDLGGANALDNSNSVPSPGGEMPAAGSGERGVVGGVTGTPGGSVGGGADAVAGSPVADNRPAGTAGVTPEPAAALDTSKHLPHLPKKVRTTLESAAPDISEGDVDGQTWRVESRDVTVNVPAVALKGLGRALRESGWTSRDTGPEMIYNLDVSGNGTETYTIRTPTSVSGSGTIRVKHMRQGPRTQALDTEQQGSTLRLSRSSRDKNVAPLSLDLVEKVANKIAARRLSGVKVEVVPTEDALPGHILQKALEEGAKGEVIAVHDNGTVYVVADRHSSEAEVEESILHEGTHVGRGVLFGGLAVKAYGNLWKAIGGEKGLREWAKQLGFSMEEYFQSADAALKEGRTTTARRAALLVDEFLAKAQGQQAYNTLPQKIRQAIREFMGAIRQALRTGGYIKLAKFNDADLAYLLRNLRSAAGGKQQSESLQDPTRFSREKQTSSPAFKKWFGGSKVVDADGNPLVVYHGGRPGIEAFAPNKRSGAIEQYAMFFTPSTKAANAYASRRSDPQVYPVYLRVNNPKYVTDPKDLQVLSQTQLDALVAAGYDGIVYPGRVTKGGFLRRAKLDPYYAEIAVFSPGQIKSAIGNNGQFDSNNDDIRFSRKAPVQKMSEPLLNATKDLFTDKTPGAINLLLNPTQIAELNPKYPSAGLYADAVQSMQVDMLRNQHRIAGLVDKMSRLPKASKDALMDLMTRSTLLGVNPDIKATETITQDIDGRTVEISNAHLATRANGAVQYEAVRKQFEALPSEAKQIYTAIRNHFADTWNQRIETIRTLADESDISAPTRARLNREMDALAAKIVGPYFPLMREGRFAVVWKSQELLDAEEKGDTATVDRLKESASDYWVTFTDSQSDAKALAATPPAGVKADAKGDYKLRTTASRDAEGASSKFMLDLEQALVKRIGDADVRGEVMQSVRGVFLETLPELSVMKRTLMRRGVAGVNSNDMLQSIARAGIADAHYLARISHMGDIVESLSNLRKEDANLMRGTKKPGEVGTPQGGIGRVYNAMMKSFQADMLRPEASNLNGFANKLTGLSYIHSLALDTGNLVANVLQPQMTSFPLMGSRFGFAKSEGAMVAALRDTIAMVGTNLTAKNLDVKKLPNTLGEHEAVKSILDLAELSQSRELAMIGRGDSYQWNRMLEVLGTPSHYVETVSRLSTMLAAYRLELGRIQKDANYANRTEQERRALAVRYASRLAGESLGNYTAGGVPNALRGNHQALTRLALQFKRYAVVMLYLYGKAARDAVQGNKEAQKTLAALITLQFTIAGGLSGLPTALPAKLVAALFPGDDDDESEEEKLDRLAEYMAGGDKKTALWLRKGPLSAMTGIDINRKMGLGDVLALNMSGVGELAVEGVAEARRMVRGKNQVTPRRPGRDTPLEWVVNNIIPSSSAVTRIGNGLLDISNGNLAEGIAKTLPKNMFTALYAEQVLDKTRKIGMTNRAGTQTRLAPDQYSEWDILAKSIDLPLLKESEVWAKTEAFDARKSAKADRRADILERYVAAKKLGDTDKVASIKDEIKAFNADLPPEARKSLRITEADMISRIHSAKKADKQSAAAGGVRATRKERKWAQSVTNPYNP